MTIKEVLVYDLETDDLITTKANMKWFGCYSYKTNQYHEIDMQEPELEDKKELIKAILQSHKILVGFNNKHFDNEILKREGYSDFKYKVVIDLWEIAAPRGNGGFGKDNKNKLQNMGFKLKDFKLKSIIETLKLDKINKRDIDYLIFKKDNWNKEEMKEIKKYLKQDIELTKKLFEWFEGQFSPLKEFLPQKDINNFKYISTSLASLAYQIICNQAGLPVEWEDNEEVLKNKKSFEGGHHINPRWEKNKGNIAYIDFTSAYPHALMMGNLYSQSKDGWNGSGYYELQGNYDIKQQGKIEKALKDIFLKRLEAKRNGDKIKSGAYKIVINSLYGLTGNPVFKSLFNTDTAADCTKIVRTWMKKLAKILEENGFICLYGFTDSIIVKIPQESSLEELMYVVNKFIEEVKSKIPFPADTFGMDIEHEIKFIWFVNKKHNCYLWLDKDDKLYYKSTLLNTNTPQVVMDVFNEYITPKIIKELDVNFIKEELESQVKERLKQNPELASQQFKVGEKSQYKVSTSINFQIADKYGENTSHSLIPNIANVGVGKSKQYCSIKEFKDNGLDVKHIDIKPLMAHLKPFYSTMKDKTLNRGYQ
jgi:DNA polymerase elongation subunit (family B)